MLFPSKQLIALLLAIVFSAACSDVPLVQTTPTTKEPRHGVSHPSRDADSDQAGAVDAAVGMPVDRLVVLAANVQRYEIAVNVQRLKDAAWVIATAKDVAERSARVAAERRVTGAPPVATSGNYNATGSVNGYPCGGDLPSCCTLRAESGGQPTAQNPTSSSSGLWQFLDSTWAGYGGYTHAAYAPAEVQNERARQVFNGGRGASNWYGDGCYDGR